MFNQKFSGPIARSTLIFISISTMFFLFASNCSKQKTSSIQSNEKHRFIYNNDGTEILGNRWHNFRPLTVDDVHSYVDIVDGTDVTTFMICSGSMLLYYDSQFERPLGVGKNGKITVDCSEEQLGENMQRYGRNFLALKKNGTDIVELCVNRAKEKGLEAFISMRMNDLHFTDTSLNCPSAQSDIWLDHPEWRMGDHPGWHADGALNFAHEGVRQYKLNLIREQCERFNLDGIELDFMRFIVYFPFNHGREYLDVMTDFMQQARQIVDEIAAKRGRPILLAVRVPARFDLALEKGLDVPAWVRQNLVDMITISSHWLGDPALPVREFREKLGPTDIPVYASLESGQYNPYLFRSNGMYRAIASHCLSQGADGIYLFNFFFKEFLDESKNDQVGGLVSTMRTPSLLKELSSLNKMAGRNKMYSLSDGCVEYSYAPNTPLPLFISPWDEIDVELELAENFEDDQPQRALLFLRIQDKADLKVKFNHASVEVEDAELVQKFERDKGLRQNESVFVFSIPPENLLNGKNVITVRSVAPSPMFLKRLELATEYGDVGDCGYF